MNELTKEKMAGKTCMRCFWYDDVRLAVNEMRIELNASLHAAKRANNIRAIMYVKDALERLDVVFSGVKK